VIPASALCRLAQVNLGTARQEVDEALVVAVYMTRGLIFIHFANGIAAFDEAARVAATHGSL
jgi:hypothetical protein